MNKEHDADRVRRPGTVTYPVASFTLKRSQIAWIAERAEAAGKSKSAFLRDLLKDIIEGKDKAA